ncbi:MAG: prepilin peptidase [Pseudomonadota bacterium]
MPVWGTIFAETFVPAYQGFWLVIIVLLGACLGSFATAWTYRLPRNIPMGRRGRRGKYSRSACPKCDHELAWFDLVPVLSWAFNRGRCRYCRAVIPYVYPITEILTITLCVTFFLLYGYTAQSLILVVMTPVIVTVLMVDIYHMIIPDRLNAVLALGGLAAVISYMAYGPVTDPEAAELMKSALIGGGAFFLVALVLALVFSHVLKKEALGGGDIKFFGAAGIWLGLESLPMFMMLSGGFGIVFALVWRKITGEERFPFGPALVAAFIFLLCAKKTVF